MRPKPPPHEKKCAVEFVGTASNWEYVILVRSIK